MRDKKVTLLINEKGGVGKTTITYNLAWELSRTNRVLMIDLDGQKGNLTFYAGVDKENIQTMYEVLTSGADIKKAIKRVKDNLYIIPADDRVCFLPQNIKVSKTKEVIEELKPHFDYILIDVTPMPSMAHHLALSITDYVLIPMECDFMSYEANKGITESIIDIKKTTNPDMKVLGIICTRYNERTNLTHFIEENAHIFEKALDTTMFETSLRNCTKIKESVGEHVGFRNYSCGSSQGTIALKNELRKLTNEFERRVNNDNGNV